MEILWRHLIRNNLPHNKMIETVQILHVTAFYQPGHKTQSRAIRICPSRVPTSPELPRNKSTSTILSWSILREAWLQYSRNSRRLMCFIISQSNPAQGCRDAGTGSLERSGWHSQRRALREEALGNGRFDVQSGEWRIRALPSQVSRVEFEMMCHRKCI